MDKKWLHAFVLGAAMLTATMAGAAPAVVPTTPAMQALRQLEPGEWEVRERVPGAAPRRLCAADLQALLQLRHGRNICKPFIVSDAADALVVTYDCDGAGNGRTALRVETNRLAQIQTQGIADGAPFDMAFEARRVGLCH